MISVLVLLCITNVIIVVLLFVIDGDHTALLFTPLGIVFITMVVEDIQFDIEIDNVKQDFLEGKYVIQYTYVDSIKVDSTYVLKENVFKHK